MSSTPPPPTDWPQEVSDLYSPVRVIGKGGFASVWMATPKTSKTGSAKEHVAIKVMQNDGYATREMAILSELTTKYPHPNIVRLLHDFRADDVEKRATHGVNCVVLSLARGPTLNLIMSKHGGLGLVIAQIISRQLIDAIAFLHGHAVIHRDIQPANIIVSGAVMTDDLWWSDDLDADGKLANMAKNCNITLVDFGFARALSPNDINSDVGLKKIMDESKSEGRAGPEGIEEQAATKDYDVSCINEALSGEERGRGRSRTRDNLDASISHARIRDLSALGTRNYAAPEILSGVRRFADALDSSFRSLNSSNHKPETTTKPLGECVSDYGMVADAFSVGATIRHMVTGVPPSVNVEDFIASRNAPMKKLAKRLSKRLSFKKNDNKRSKKYRTSCDLPEEVEDLIQALTHYNSRKRATVRAVTGHPWIKLSHDDAKERMHGGPVVYLQCGEVEKKKNEKK